MGRQADGGQRRDRRPRRRDPGGSPGAAGDGVRPRVPQGDAQIRPGQPPRRLVRAHQRERAGRSLRRPAWPQGPDRVREAVCEGAREDESAGGAQADRADRRRPSVSQRPAAANRLADLHDPADPRGESDYVGDLLDQYVASLDDDKRYLFGTYEYVDLARKVVGVGSVGTRAWVLPFTGRQARTP
jgi:hypothetical protein